MTHYMKTSTVAPNATEVIGIFRFCLGLRCGCARQLACAMDALRYIARLDIRSLHPQPFAVLRTWADTVLCAALDRARQQRTLDSDFLALHRASVGLLVDDAAVSKVIAASSYTEVPKELGMLVSSCDIGGRLYLSPFESVLSATVTKMIDDNVVALFNKQKTLDDAALLDLQAAVASKVGAMEGINFLPAKREVKVFYRGQPIGMKVCSYAEQISLVCAAAIKEVAVESKLVDKMWGENVLVASNYKSVLKMKVDATLAKATQVARAACKLAISDSGADTPGTILQTCRTKSPQFLDAGPQLQARARADRGACR